MVRVKAEYPEIILVQGYASSHTALFTKKALQSVKIDLMGWTSFSSDLYLIESL